MTARTISEISIHCSATRPQWMVDRPGLEKVAEIRRWHVEDNGWSNIGYHFIVDRDGSFYRGRPEQTAGAFEPKVNARAIGICLIGGFGSTMNDKFSKNYTAKQESTLVSLVKSLQDKYPMITKITGHNDYSQKACPGFRVADWLRTKSLA